MSDENPFDEDLHETLCDLIRNPLGLTRVQASNSASYVADYIAARERKAAAKALREAAKAIDGMDSCAFDDFIHGPALWLRCRADDIERGEA